MPNNEKEMPKTRLLSDDMLEVDKLKQQQLTRLPCRGCLASCSYYPRCEGKLWSMTL